MKKTKLKLNREQIRILSSDALSHVDGARIRLTLAGVCEAPETYRTNCPAESARVVDTCG
ncbi:MAG: hypothetical protein ABI678_04705 [Kofleriaceae bacterium]